MRPLIVFDLDGTLVDSAAGIARVATNAMQSAGIHATLNETDVGPPLQAMISMASGLDTNDRRILEAIAVFKKNYDPICHELCLPYDGTYSAIAELFTLFDLAVATNKRSEPTIRILRAFDLQVFFNCGVYCAGDPGSPTKGQALLKLRSQRPQSFCGMVGDTVQDWKAAQEGRFDHFFLAAWGNLCEFERSMSLDSNLVDGSGKTLRTDDFATVQFEKVLKPEMLPEAAFQGVNTHQSKTLAAREWP